MSKPLERESDQGKSKRDQERLKTSRAAKKVETILKKEQPAQAG